MVSLLQLEEQSSVAGPLGHQPRLRNTTTCCQSGVLTVRSQCSAQTAALRLIACVTGAVIANFLAPRVFGRGENRYPVFHIQLMLAGWALRRG